eukprot:CAMPEP_0201526216 /NCGR_PEP_ID=MMETSP0161_2-20130828/31019_1 /ASSEMBLY_ACC=CAM_ASM_000251 /TAXON_ID=180227 /ORGANISM="Neoparamoeba aestuarina, Strain SoJaBio B1-5/56/2" /LENGTH=474 /DNA_ID=CAMNT_0047926509 /DNA_START=117 /DNA_END=1538 /DNA_ORIENTATION=+
MALYKVQVPSLQTPEKCASRAELIVDRIRKENLDELEYLARLREELKIPAREKVEENRAEANRAIDTQNGLSAAIPAVGISHHSSNPNTPTIALDPEPQPKISASLEPEPNPQNVEPESLNRPKGYTGQFDDCPDKDPSPKLPKPPVKVIKLNPVQDKGIIDQMKDYLKSQDAKDLIIETRKVALKGAVVGVIVALLSEKLRVLVCQQQDYAGAALLLLKSSGVGAFVGAAGHLLLEALEKFFLSSRGCWVGVGLLVAIFQIVGLLLKFGEKGATASFFRDCVGATSSVVLVTTYAAFCTAVPAASFSIASIKFISSLTQNYDSLSNENPSFSFLQLFPMAISAVFEDFGEACREWAEWATSVFVGGTPTAKLMRVLDEVDQSEEAEDLREELAEWENVPKVFECPLTMSILRFPRFVKGFVFERDVIVQLAKDHRRHPFLDEELSILDVKRNEEFEACLRMYIKLRWKETGER